MDLDRASPAAASSKHECKKISVLSQFISTMSHHLLRVVVSCLVAMTIALLLLERRDGPPQPWQIQTLRAGTSSGCEFDSRPPLSALIDYEVVDKHRIKSDPQFLLDFAIIGHPKTAT